MATFHDFAHEQKMYYRYSMRINAGLLLALGLALWGWHHAAKDITVYYPPNIALSTIMKAGTIPEETVYAFVPLIMQQLFLWDTNGEDDYEKNRSRLRAFLTESYQKAIREEVFDARTRGTLKGVTRRMQVLPSPYKDATVQTKGNHWLVWMDVEVVDSVNGVPVNTSVRRLGVRVTRFDVNREINPWQLAIDGIEQDIALLSEGEARKLKQSVSKGG